MTVIIPAYKPDEKLIGLLHALKEKDNLSILVINDGSGAEFDPIFREVKALGCTLLVHPENKGKGAALKTAFQYLLKNCDPGESFCTADADGQHLPKDIFRCLKEAEENPGTLIIGGRDLKNNVPARSLIGNAFSRWSFLLFMGKKIYDTQTGLRAFTGELLPKLIEVKGERYEYEMQMLCLFARKKWPMKEIPIETVYLEENKSSHFNAFRDAFRVYSILLQNTWLRLKEPVSFLCSSGLAFFIDLVLYYILFNFIFPLCLKNPAALAFSSLFIARTVSSIANYCINRKIVFHSHANPKKSSFFYLLLVIGVFFGNHYINVFFLAVCRFHEITSLILAQCICFPVSYLIQKLFIFRNSKKKR